MGSHLPTGTVTFLFTDVEGSTRLLHEMGSEAYAKALAEHRRVIREACAAEGGVEVDTQGDAFFFAFPTAPGALAAARALTERLAGEGPIQVRVGLHTGTPLVTEESYVGDDVHRAARIAASGHGGQVLVSSVTERLVDVELRDLGEHRLKDIAEPVAICQLGEERFPPLKTISNTNLPRPASSFVGREIELEEVLSRVQDGARLVTLTGAGGTGKTRLALEAATTLVPEYKAGVFWVGLASLRDPALVTETIAQVLGAKDGLAKHVANREMLLLLDNLEQVVEAAPALSTLLQSCPNLALLVTSRELLRISGEVEYPVPPLANSKAVELFCERSQLDPSDEISELCARLDSLPLAVELAAARTKALTPAQILERLSGRLDLLQGGRDADPRQQTLRATIEWSYDLLSPEEQQLFARLSVFAGGCTLDAAEEVCDADLDTVQSLVGKSLLRFTASDTGGRYWMLETIREYAGELLEESGEDDARRSLHAYRYARIAEEIERPLRDYAEQALVTVQAEIDNMRAGLAYALDRDEVVAASRYIAGLWFYWLTSGRGGEAIAWARRYTAAPRERVEPLARFQGDGGAGEIFRFAGDPETAMQLKRELVQTGRANPDAVVNEMPVERAVAATLSDLAYMELDAGRPDVARSSAEEALAMRRELGILHGVAHALLALAAVEYGARDFGRARDVYAEAAAVYEEAGSRGDVLSARFGVAECALLLGALEEAEGLLREALVEVRDLADLGFEFETYGLRAAAMLAAAKGNAEASAVLLGAVDGRLRASGIGLFGKLEEELQRTYLEQARQAMGETRFQIAFQRGIDGWADIGREVALASLD